LRQPFFCFYNVNIMELKIEKALNITNWDEELKRNRGSVFLSPAWLEAFKNPQHNPIYFRFHSEGETRALLAGLERPVAGGSHKQLFFYSGIASQENSPHLISICRQKLLEYSQRMAYSRIIFKSYDYNNYVVASSEHFKGFKRAECVINLDRSRERIIQSINPDTRRRVRRAKDKNLTFGYGNSPQLLDSLFELMETTHEVRVNKGYGGYRMFTMPFLNREVILKLLEKNTATIFHISLGSQIISSQLVVGAAGRSYGIYMGSRPEAYKISAPTALIYDVVLKYKSEGYYSYNMGGVPLGEKNNGVLKYKLDFGSTLVESSELTTAFLTPALSRYNGVISLKNKLMFLPMIPWRVKKIMLKPIEAIINGKDQY
jgi:hypothetical protein